MASGAWLDLEKLAKGTSTPTVPKKVTDASSSGKQLGPRQQKSTVGHGRPAIEDARASKKARGEDKGFDCWFELENDTPRVYEDFKNDPLDVCGDICKSASKVFKDLKIEAASARRERDTALKRLADLEPQIKALEEKDKQLEEAKNARDNAEKERKLAEDDRAKMLKKNKELLSQNKNLQDQAARFKEEKAEAVAAEVQRVAGLARGAALFQFENAVGQMKIFNAARGVQFDGRIVNAEHVIEEGEIVLPQKMDDEGKVTQKRTVVFGRPKK